ncbi:MAG: SMR family transporter [Desulfobulbus sp.]|jgi:small multidrug resistance pump|nr:SMR family transporter [Desulfobulbus sp.]
MTYLYLAIAIIAEVTATTALKASEEFTRITPSVVVILGYGVAFYFMTLVLRDIPIGITYAIWSGLGIVLVTIIGFFFYKQTLDIPAIIGISLIVSGVIVINVFSNITSH